MSKLRTSELAAPRATLARLAAALLLFGAIADFLLGSPGDASALLAGFVASGAGVLVLRSDEKATEQWNPPLTLGNKHAVAFALFAFSAAAVFAKIAEDVAQGESASFDIAASLWIHRYDTPLLDTFMLGASSLGEYWIATFCAVPILIWCVRRKDKAASIGLIAIVGGELGLRIVLKAMFHRPRPNLFHEVPPLHSYSFPSAHSMVAVTIYGMIAIVVARLAPRFGFGVKIGVALLALLIGYSRVYLGVHWLTDVLGGYAIGSAALALGLVWLALHPPLEESRS